MDILRELDPTTVAELIDKLGHRVRLNRYLAGLRTPERVLVVDVQGLAAEAQGLANQVVAEPPQQVLPVQEDQGLGDGAGPAGDVPPDQEEEQQDNGPQVNLI